MGLAPELLFGKVLHERTFPKKNLFSYGIYYLLVPLSELKNLPMARNRAALMSFYDRDHGPCDGKDLSQWARKILSGFNVKEANGEIILVCMPRVLGYVFNPVSFWLCLDNKGCLRAVLCEVHNTFGERHTYICAHNDNRVIQANDRLKGEKTFHVSPFLKREGNYEFCFDIRSDRIRISIEYFDAAGRKQLITSLAGTLAPMNTRTLRKVFWRYPLITFKAIALIHWQAVKLFSKGIRYSPKPRQNAQRITTTSNLKKM